MSDIERLISSEKIVEWIGLRDSRLLEVTGEERRGEHMGTLLRRRWELGMYEESVLAIGVLRLLVPDTQMRSGIDFTVEQAAGYMTRTAMVELTFNRFVDAASIMPLKAKNLAINRAATEHRPAMRAWTVVGVAEHVGLAVFAQDLRHHRGDSISPDVQARVQTIRPEILEKLQAA